MSYIGNEPIVSATRTVTEVTATAGQTVFNANGGYTVGYLDVFLNGSKLTSTDFTATNGTTVTLTEAAQVSDIVRLEALGTFQAANAVLLTGDSNLTGNLNVSGNLGVGTTSPGQKLQISNTSSSGFAAIRLAANSRTYDIGIGGSTSGFQQNNYYLFDATAGQPRLSIDTSGNLGFNSGYGSVATAYGCRAWVNFNGTGTVAIRASGNVSSITDNGNGQYTVNFTNAMPDVNYAATFNGNGNSDSFGSGGRQYSMIRTRATNSVQLNTIDEGGNQTDPSYVGLSIFR
jgi:uncharacterized protein (AIM24 family)